MRSSPPSPVTLCVIALLACCTLAHLPAAAAEGLSFGKFAGGGPDTTENVAAAAAAAVLSGAGRDDLRAVRDALEAAPSSSAARDARGFTALMLTSDVGVMRALLGAGADPNAVSPDGLTVLMHVASRGHAAGVHALLAAGARVGTGTPQGVSALMVAAAAGHEDVVHELVAASTPAQVLAMDEQGWSARRWAEAARQRDAEALLASAEGLAHEALEKLEAEAGGGKRRKPRKAKVGAAEGGARGKKAGGAPVRADAPARDAPARDAPLGDAPQQRKSEGGARKAKAPPRKGKGEGAKGEPPLKAKAPDAGGAVAEMLAKLRVGADAGDAHAQFLLGRAHAAGRGVVADPREAAAWWLKAARGGSVDAMYNLGVSYANGEGVERSSADAARWLKEAADKGHTPAATALAQLQVALDAEVPVGDAVEL